MSFGALAFWVVSLFTLNEKVSKKDLLILFFCAILGTTVNQLTFIEGLGMTFPIDAGLIVTMNPVMVMLISALVLKEPITSKKAGGVLIGACGALLIIWQSYTINQGHGGSLRGNLLCFISVVSYATYLVISKPIAQRYSPVTLMKWMFLFSTILMLPFSMQDVVNSQTVLVGNDIQRTFQPVLRGILHHAPRLPVHPDRLETHPSHDDQHVQLRTTAGCRHFSHSYEPRYANLG